MKIVEKVPYFRKPAERLSGLRSKKAHKLMAGGPFSFKALPIVYSVTW